MAQSLKSELFEVVQDYFTRNIVTNLAKDLFTEIY